MWMIYVCKCVCVCVSTQLDEVKTVREEATSTRSSCFLFADWLLRNVS